MRIERLFNVLVLGGAALSGGCSDADDEKKNTDGLGRGDGNAGSSAGDAASGAGGAESAGGATAGALAAGGSAIEIVCTEDPAAPCGCPCCWASDCANDEPCCAGFCESGNDGKGCCPP